MNSPAPITLLIVDDHALVRRGIRAFLETQPDLEVCGEAASGEDAVRLAAEKAPDVILMDLIMPGLDGVEATRQIKQASPRSQIIILTSYHEDEHIFPAIRAGALSYLLKDIRPEELAAAVRKAAFGEAILHPQVAARLVQEVQGSRQEPASPFAELKRARNGSAAPGCRRHEQYGDRRAIGGERQDREKPRFQYPGQAAPGRPHSGGSFRLAGRPGTPRCG